MSVTVPTLTAVAVTQNGVALMNTSPNVLVVRRDVSGIRLVRWTDSAPDATRIEAASGWHALAGSEVRRAWGRGDASPSS